MEEDLYDEFGNYIGPEIRAGDYDSDEDHPRKNKSSDDEEQSSEVVVSKSKFLNYGSRKQDGEQRHRADEVMEDDESYKGGYQVVLHEDKQYYPDAEKIYGPGVETLVMDEDAQPLT